METNTEVFEHAFNHWWRQGQDFYAQLGQYFYHDNPVQQVLQQQYTADFYQWLDMLNQQPQAIFAQQMDWWQQQLQIMQHSCQLAMGEAVEALKAPETGDKRFSHSQWQQNPWFYFIQQSYLLMGEALLNSIQQTAGLDGKLKERLAFSARQMINSLAPTNFISTNPELLEKTIESNGQNLVQGFQLFKQDLARSSNLLRISMTRDDAFVVGQQLATTAGQVVFRNHLFELIQYTPLTEQVACIPLLIVPPYVNKYYILDLKPENSLVRYALEQGQTVFMMSWVNPDPSMAQIDFADYVVDGVLAAADVVSQLTAEPQLNAMGYCIGGTLLVTAMAYHASKRMKPRFKSATLLTTLLDFTQPGELGVFINDATISAIEHQNQQLGVMPGDVLGVSFSLLRENSLYWNYYVNNYLKGQTPADLDVLFWNGDSTNLSAACHNFMLRELYLNNKLVIPKAISIKGVKIDLAKVRQPIYMLSTRDDHIALWQATWQGIQHTGAKVTFVLGESGHIAGVINAPSRQKYGYWYGPEVEGLAENWLKQAQHAAGSWWPHWLEWLASQQGEWVPARQLDNSLLVNAVSAPGEYVLMLSQTSSKTA